MFQKFLTWVIWSKNATQAILRQRPPNSRQCENHIISKLIIALIFFKLIDCLLYKKFLLHVNFYFGRFLNNPDCVSQIRSWGLLVFWAALLTSCFLQLLMKVCHLPFWSHPEAKTHSPLRLLWYEWRSLCQNLKWKQNI